MAPMSQATVDLGGFVESFGFDAPVLSVQVEKGSQQLIATVEAGETLFPLSEAMSCSGASLMSTPLTWQASSAYSGNPRND